MDNFSATLPLLAELRQVVLELVVLADSSFQVFQRRSKLEKMQNCPIIFEGELFMMGLQYSYGWTVPLSQ
jgi:hypothetical protein